MYRYLENLRTKVWSGVKQLCVQFLMYTMEKRILPLILVCYGALLVESTNTYNNIDSSHMFNEGRASVPALLACIESCYGFQPHLPFGDCVVLGIDVAFNKVITWFPACLSKHFISLCKGSKGSARNKINAWYLDDGTLCGFLKTLHWSLEIKEEDVPACQA